MSFPKSHVAILTPNVIDLGNRAFWGCLSHEAGALMNGIYDPLKDLRKCFRFLYDVRLQ